MDQKTPEQIAAEEEARIARRLANKKKASPYARPKIAQKVVTPSEPAKVVGKANEKGPAKAEPAWKRIQREKEEFLAAQAAAEEAKKRAKVAAVREGQVDEATAADPIQAALSAERNAASSSFGEGAAASSPVDDQDDVDAAVAAEEARLAKKMGLDSSALEAEEARLLKKMGVSSKPGSRRGSTAPAEPKVDKPVPVEKAEPVKEPEAEPVKEPEAEPVKEPEPEPVKEPEPEAASAESADEPASTSATARSSGSGIERWNALQAKRRSLQGDSAASDVPAVTTEAVPEETESGADLASVEAAGSEVAAAVADTRACIGKGAGVDKASTDVASAAASLDKCVDALGTLASGAVVSAQRTGLRASVDSFVSSVAAWVEEPEDEDVVELVTSRLDAVATDATKLVGGVRKAVAKSSGGSGSSKGGSTISPKAATSNVSSMVETADKSAYELVYDTLGTDKAQMTLSSLRGRAIRFAEVEVIKHDANKVENRTHVRNYQLPFCVDASLIEAHFVADAQQLRVTIPKSAEVADSAAATAADDESQYGVLLTFKTKGNPAAATESVDMDVAQTAESVVVTIAPARANEEVTVTVGRDSLDVEAVRTVEETRDDGTTVITKKTVTDTLSLPFPLSRDAVTVSNINDDDDLAGRTLVLAKPKSKAIDPKEQGDIIEIS